MSPPDHDPSSAKAITIIRIIGWGAIVFSLFTVITVLYVGFIQ